MAKSDFCFTFYDGDAARDVSHMNRIERGGYFDIIISQRKFGYLTLDQIKKILGRDFEETFPAIELVLKTTEDGLFFIEWLQKSELKAKSHSSFQSINGKLGGRPENNPNKSRNKAEVKPNKSQMKANTNPNLNKKKPLEDGDGDGDEDVLGTYIKKNESEKFTIVAQMKDRWEKAYPAAFIDTTDIEPLRQVAEKIFTWNKLKGAFTDELNKNLIIQKWGEIIDHCKDDPHLSKYSISQINKYFSSVIQSLQSKKNGTHKQSSGKNAGAEQLLAKIKHEYDANERRKANTSG